MPRSLHAKASVDGRKMLGGHGEIVIARQQDRAVTKLIVDAEDRSEIFKAAVDDIAQRHHEGQVLAVEGVDRVRKLFRALAIITAHLGTRIGISILGIGDDAEGEERCGFFSHDAPR